MHVSDTVRSRSCRSLHSRQCKWPWPKLNHWVSPTSLIGSASSEMGTYYWLTSYLNDAHQSLVSTPKAAPPESNHWLVSCGTCSGGHNSRWRLLKIDTWWYRSSCEDHLTALRKAADFALRTGLTIWAWPPGTKKKKKKEKQKMRDAFTWRRQ